MSDIVLEVLIIAVAVVVILIFFRDKLGKFYIKFKGMDASLETRNRASVDISGNVQSGKRHKIQTNLKDVKISDNLQEGEENLIDATSENKKKA
jgi:hypothetical protein